MSHTGKYLLTVITVLSVVLVTRRMSPGFLCCEDLHLRHWGLTKERSDYIQQALQVCCDRFYAQAPVQFRIEWHGGPTEVWITWSRPEDRVHASWRNRPRITEHAAYCVALSAVESLRHMVAVSDGEITSGADFFVAKRDGAFDNLEKSLKFEVAGLGRGSDRALRRKVREKVQQVRRGRPDLPGIVCVVGFEARLILVEDVTWP